MATQMVLRISVSVPGQYLKGVDGVTICLRTTAALITAGMMLQVITVLIITISRSNQQLWATSHLVMTAFSVVT